MYWPREVGLTFAVVVLNKSVGQSGAAVKRHAKALCETAAEPKFTQFSRPLHRDSCQLATSNVRIVMELLDPELYTVAWMAPLEIEARAALLMLDNRHRGRFPVSKGDDYIFQAGDVCGHNVIIASLPAGQEYGVGSAAALAAQVKKCFPNLWFGLLVGVAAGLPNLSGSKPRDIRLGDVLVALPEGDSAGLIAYELGKETGSEGFQLLRFGHVLANTETVVRSAIGAIKLNAPYDADTFLPYYEHIKDKKHIDGTFVDPSQDKDKLYQVDELEVEKLAKRERRPNGRRTRVWYGPIGSGDKLMNNARKRNELRDRYNVIGLEMAAAGTMNLIPVGVIRGVCDYGDEHKNNEWQPYAAAMAAAYAKAILFEIRSGKVRTVGWGQTQGKSQGNKSIIEAGPGSGDVTKTKLIPFCRDPDFVPRGDLVDQMARRCAQPPSRVALVGLSGVGKSQLMWVFWVHAGTQARFEEGIRTIADTVQLVGRDQPGANVPQLLCQWLSNERIGRWLLILDSADNSDVFYAKGDARSAEPLATNLPQSRNGSILITTCDGDLAFRLTGHRENVIAVGPMAETDALTLLERRLGTLSDVAVARELVHALELVPLAISQAGAYIQAQGRRSSLVKYLSSLRKNERTKAWLLSHDFGEIRRYGGASNSILATWQILFEHIRSRRSSAVDLLSLMSFFKGPGIPESLLMPSGPPRIMEADDDNTPESDDSDCDIEGTDEMANAFNDDIAMLEAYCLITATKAGDVFEMHGLVQLSMRKWLEAKGSYGTFKELFIKRMRAAFQVGGYNNRASCKIPFPHVEAATDYRKSGDGQEEWGTLLYKGA